MSATFLMWALAASSMASALVAGVFLSFSDFTMRSLRAAAPKSGVEAMQILNREVFRSVFIALLIGMTPVSAAIGLAAIFWPTDAAAGLIIAGSISYVLGVFLVTMLGNVPKNEKLADLPDASTEAQAYWPTYYSGWIFWNHVRTFFSFATAVCYLIAAIQLASIIGQ